MLDLSEYTLLNCFIKWFFLFPVLVFPCALCMAVVVLRIRFRFPFAAMLLGREESSISPSLSVVGSEID